MATRARVGVVLDERAVPDHRRGPRRRASCSASTRCVVANEGKAVMGVRAERVDAVLATLREHPLGRNAAIVGDVHERPTRIARARHRVRPTAGVRARRRASSADLLKETSWTTFASSERETTARSGCSPSTGASGSTRSTCEPPAILRKAGLQLARDTRCARSCCAAIGGVFCSGADLKYIRARRRRADLALPEPRQRETPTGLRRDLQSDPRIHPQHHLGDPPRAQALHRRGRRRGRRGRTRARPGLRSRHRVRAVDVRVRLLQDGAQRRGELDVLPAEARGPAARRRISRCF